MNKVKRRAPKNGYDNPEKRKYRHNVWKYLSKKAIPILDKNENAKVLMLPSKEGLEIDVAIKFGIEPEQIIAIDENPALLAHAKWKSKIPKENSFGCKVSKIGEKIKEKGWILAAANLDFCNNFSKELIEEVNGFFITAPRDKKFSFCITIGKGRESKALFMLIKRFNIKKCFKHDRLATLYEMIYGFDKKHISLDFEKSYCSSFPMIYAGFSFHYLNLEQITGLIKRRRVLFDRIYKLEGLTIHKGIYHKAYLHQLHEFYDMESVKYQINRTERYMSNDITYNDRQNKKSELLNYVRNELREVEDNIDKYLYDYANKINLVEEGSFIGHYYDEIKKINQKLKNETKFSLTKYFGRSKIKEQQEMDQALDKMFG